MPPASEPELLELLLRGEQIALGALDDESRGIVVDVELERGGARAQPLWQAREFDRPHGKPRARGFECFHPRGRVLLALELAGEHEVDVVGADIGEQIDDGVAAARARLARRQADLDELARPEQREVVRRGAHRFPVGHALDEMDFALVEAGAPGARADGVGRLTHEQSLIA